MVLSEEHVRKEDGGRQARDESSSSGYTWRKHEDIRLVLENPGNPDQTRTGLQDAAALTSTLQTQLLWYSAEYSFPTLLKSLTSHTYTLWSLYTQVRWRLAGSKLRASVSGY